METIYYTSIDGVKITADLYREKNHRASLVLCHMANSSRGEYRESAHQLLENGYLCLVPDLRSGKSINEVVNETAERAKAQRLPTQYTDAKPDIVASVAYARRFNNPIILVGSSYSASLAPLVALEEKGLKAVAMFSPGEYFKGIKLAESIADLRTPVFVTSARSEFENATAVVRNVDRQYVTEYCPELPGAHGSRSLWSEVDGSEEMWKVFLDFLAQN